MCPPLETPDLVHQATDNPEGQTHSGSSERNCRQTVSSGTGDPDRVVTLAGSVSGHLPEMVLPPGGPVRHQVQSQTVAICESGTRSQSMGSGCWDTALGESGAICLSTNCPTGQSGGEAQVQPLQENHSDCSGVAQHALVPGPGGLVSPSATVPATVTQLVVPTVQQDSSQQSGESKSPCLASRAETVRGRGFSEAVAARIEAPQRRSTRKVYEGKWAVFEKWCQQNKVDVRAPPIASIADFLLHLFENQRLQPGTIEGYRSAFTNKLGNDPVQISHNEELTRLMDSFHRDRPKKSRGVPAWNLALVLHHLTKPPFEPLRNASLKHLTFKTVFLLALASGKRRSEIHAWLLKNVRYQDNGTKVSLTPSARFLSKNQLAKEGPESVAPVIIPSLAATLDRSLTDDKTLCPVRALRYYLDRTTNIRRHQELAFLSFKKGFEKDIARATISSWIKQTVMLCYELSDSEARTLHQVKAHDVRAFAAPRAFHAGVPLERILSACHWKSHNTFTQFYLKDLAWADSEHYHLGPIVAAQEVHQ